MGIIQLIGQATPVASAPPVPLAPAPQATDWLVTIFNGLRADLEIVNQFIITPSPGRAILFALLLSGGFTQLIKFRPKLLNLDPDTYKTVVEMVAVFIAFAVVLVLWPDVPKSQVPIEWVTALATGLWSPWLYKKSSIVLFHYFPSLEDKVSGTPANIEQQQSDSKGG